MEGAGIYEFGLARAEATTDMKIFNTRTIGLSEGRERVPVPITAGARMTGNLKGFTLGLMNVQTDSLESQDEVLVSGSTTAGATVVIAGNVNDAAIETKTDGKKKVEKIVFFIFSCNFKKKSSLHGCSSWCR